MIDQLVRYGAEDIGGRIYTLRGQKVIMDIDLAEIYGVTTKRLNEQVKRNLQRFPEDFMFQLTKDEAQNWHSLRSQFATLKRGQHLKYLPYAFTEHGAVMVANILKSDRAIQMSVFVVRAFIKMREVILGNKTLALKLAELEKQLTTRLNIHEKAIVHVLGEIKKLMPPASQPPEPQKRKIGFTVKETRAAYAAKKARVR